MNVKAVERRIAYMKDENNEAKKYMYVMQPVLYNKIDEDKVIQEAAVRANISELVMTVAYNALSKVLTAWATEGHSVAIPGLGTMRFGLRAEAVDKVEEVKSGLIKSRRLIFTPSVKLKQELANTSISITCIDRDGKIVKNVTSNDKDDVEDPDSENSGNTGGNTDSKTDSDTGKDNTGSDTGKDNTGSQGGGSGTGSGSGTSGDNTEEMD